MSNNFIHYFPCPESTLPILGNYDIFVLRIIKNLLLWEKQHCNLPHNIIAALK